MSASIGRKDLSLSNGSGIATATVGSSVAAQPKKSHHKKTANGTSKKVDLEYTSQMDFSDLSTRTLTRYKRIFKLRTPKHPRSSHSANYITSSVGFISSGSSSPQDETRDELLSSVTRHFQQQEVNEKETITYFIYKLRNFDKVYKLPAKAPVPTFLP
ncbi:hypothetical protein HDU85_005334 [Gaertneriomyces sp. JEL0708]|nr:hypothetical protein HDU85_005334 [Gaertneriomyces sp. JEL0708]